MQCIIVRIKHRIFILKAEQVSKIYQDGAEMRIFELKDMIDAIAEDYGDIDVCMDIADNETIFSVTQVLVETHENKLERRALLVNGSYIFDKPKLTVVK